MKLKVRSLHNVEVEIEASPDDTIRKLKEHIQEKFPNMDAELQKIIHAGKVLRDENQIKDYESLQDNERLVVILTKTIKTIAASNKEQTLTESCTSSSTTAIQATSSSSLPSARENTDSKIEKESEKTETSAPSNSSGSDPSTLAAPSRGESNANSQYDGAASALVVGTELDEVIESICAMGFPREQVCQALRAAFNNPDRAVEYLMTSIPVDRPRVLANPAVPPATTFTADNNSPIPPSSLPELSSLLPPSGTGTSNQGMQEGVVSDLLQALRNNPQFATIRESIARNPQLLPSLLQTIGNMYPGFLRAIEGHEDEFARLLLDSSTTDQQAPVNPPPTITLTLAEMDSVQRLEGLGFPRDVVLEAYVACDRNEELAANYLFEYIQDLDDGNDQ